MRMLLEDALAGLRFARQLPSFLRHPITTAEAMAVVRRRLEQRGADFLQLVRRAIYGRAESPYRQLLALAGCEYGDVERLVHDEGLEGALGILYRHGVYLTMDELKGRRPAVRGTASVVVEAGGLRNPGVDAHLVTQSSGSRGSRTLVVMDLASIRDQAIDHRLYLEARGDAGSVHAEWGIPGGASMGQLLRLACCGVIPARWFSQVALDAPGLHPRYRWSARAMRWGSVLAGAPVPRPQFVPVAAPLPVAHWMARILRSGRTPHLWTFASSAVVLAKAAREAGIDLSHARFTVAGEPFTESRLAVMSGTGAEVTSRYGCSECGQIGLGCLAPTAPDDLHVLTDLHALIQPDAPRSRPPVGASPLLVTSLRSTARLILLNASLGDVGVLADRACECPLAALGWTMHLHGIRTDEKLTAGGMNVPDWAVARVLEDVLPLRFGGVPTDYQLVEAEGEAGRAELRLLVRPDVGPVDSRQVAEAFLAALGPGSGAERIMALTWREGSVLRVERRAPISTANGKIQPVCRVPARRGSRALHDPAESPGR